MLQSEINRRMPDIVTLAIFGIWQSLQALGRAKGDEEEEHHLIASQVPNIYVEDRGWQLRKVPKLMKKLWKVMSLHHQRRWKGGKINVKSYSLKRIKCLFFYAFSSSSTSFFSPIWNKRYIPVWGCHKKFQGLLKIKRRTAKLVFHRGHECGAATENTFWHGSNVIFWIVVRGLKSENCQEQTMTMTVKWLGLQWIYT